MATINITSPGKLILSGEHAAVYGAPACAVAVQQTFLGSYQLRTDRQIRIHGIEPFWEQTLALEQIMPMQQALSARYARFTKKQLAIEHVMQYPIELCWFAIAQIFSTARFFPKNGIDIQLTSAIPVGCGMGSSAALIINLMLGMNELFGLSLSASCILQCAQVAENLQHGYSSGLDLQVSLYGGFQLFRQHHTPILLTPPTLLHPPLLSYFNSGRPASTTGECVAFVKQQQHSPAFWSKFEATTLALVAALQTQDSLQIVALIKKNHRLLCRLGIVPLSLQRTIEKIEAQGGAAKICGAGSMRGDNAGMILVANGMAWPNTTPLSGGHRGAYVH